MARVDARKKIEARRRKNGSNAQRTSTKRSNVSDLRVVLSKKRQTKDNARTNRGRVVARRAVVHTRQRNTLKGGVVRVNQYRGYEYAHPLGVNTVSKRPHQEYYVPPHLKRQIANLNRINTAMSSSSSQSSNSTILVSNLLPNVTQSDIVELFGEVGSITSINMLNPSTAMVTYSNGADALEAIRMYHNRLLDQNPMFVNLMPTPPSNAPATNVRSRIGAVSNNLIPMDIGL